MEFFLALLLALQTQVSAAAMFIPFAYWKTASSGVTWPVGALGDYSCLAGTCTLAGGTSYDYANVTVSAGATLQFTGSSNPTYFGWSAVFTLAGTVNCKDGKNAGATFSGTAPDGYAFSYTVAQKSGGDGGTSLNGIQGAGAAEGGGGGGAGSGSGPDPTPDTLGDGGPGEDGIPAATGGTAGPIYGGQGTDGQSASSGTLSLVEGAGGGGGAKAAHGCGLYLKEGPNGTTLSSGTVSASGSTGGLGGNGGAAVNSKISGVRNANGAGGGGGGAGGSGGKIVARFKSTLALWTLTAAGGSGGSGGALGTGTSTGSHTNGTAGTNGQIGNSGTVDSATY